MNYNLFYTLCTIILFYKTCDHLPLIAASNRDEIYTRRSSPPDVLAEDPVIWGGRDLKAQGTWLGVNQYGLWVGIANRESRTPRDPGKRSRGLLCMELLGEKSCLEAVSCINRMPKGLYNPFYLLVADSTLGALASDDRRGEAAQLNPGVHVLTNDGLDREGDPRRERILNRHKDLVTAHRTPSVDDLKQVLKDHGQSESDAV